MVAKDKETAFRLTLAETTGLRPDGLPAGGFTDDADTPGPCGSVLLCDWNERQGCRACEIPGLDPCGRACCGFQD